MISRIEVPCLQGFDQHSAIEDLAKRLDHQPFQAISHMPWQEHHHPPVVSFTMAYGEDAVFLKYIVEEWALRSTYIHPNDPVYNDSCVEFFIAFGEEPGYYNFEWNCAGTCLAGFGEGKERTLFPAAEVLKIRHYSRIMNSEKHHQIHWELTLILPLEVFIHHRFQSPAGQKARGNFFKCGELLPEPHHLCWNMVQSVVPEFHLSSYFGEVHFTP